MPLRILLVDDHEVVLLGLKTLLGMQPGFEVVGEAMSAREALEQARALQPDVIIMDVRLPDASGIEACRAIVNEGIKSQVIMLTSFPDDNAIFAAIEAGAKGYVLKQVESQALVRAVEAVSRGESFLDPAVTGMVFERMRVPRSKEASGMDSLTRQERSILKLIAEGKTNREIAREVHLSEKTVRNYVSAIFDKLGVSNRAEAAAYAVKSKLT